MPKDDDHLHRMNFQLGIMSERNGDKRNTSVKIDPEDIIAGGAVLVAVIFALAMTSGSMPINKYTVSVVAFSSCGLAVSKIIKARRSRRKSVPWIPYAIIAALIIAFGIYVWATWGWVSAGLT